MSEEENNKPFQVTTCVKDAYVEMELIQCIRLEG